MRYKRKTAPSWRRFEAQRAPLLAESAGSDVADLVAVDANVGERLVGQAAKFAKGTAVAEPALCNADRVHGDIPRNDVSERRDCRLSG